MTVALYTDSYTSDTSSVIDTIFFDEDTNKMYVYLLSGITCGYQASKSVYSVFAKQEELGSSLGKYWNEWVKPHLTGFSTGDIYSFESRKQPDDQDTDFVEQDGVYQFTEAVEESEAISVSSNATEHLVSFEYNSPLNGELYEGELTLFVEQDTCVITLAKNIANVSGYNNFNIKSVTIFFE